MTPGFSQFSIKMKSEFYSPYLYVDKVNNKGIVTSLYSSSWIFDSLKELILEITDQK